MLRTSTFNIPSSWIFEHFIKMVLKTDLKLQGQNLHVKSPLNLKDTNPSFFLRCNPDTKEYFFEDFSTGHKGNSRHFIKLLYNVTGSEAENIIASEFSGVDYKEDFVTEDDFETYKITLTDYKIGQWTEVNYNFWVQFGINKYILDFYNVKPLEYIEISSSKGIFKIKVPRLYGYFDKYGQLYKVYKPESDFKFLYVTSYVSGTCQLTYNTDYLLILSSLKDIMSFKSLNIGNIETVAPMSESSILPPGRINAYKIHYKKIGILFDNDDAGRRYSEIYKIRYKIDNINLDLSKDLSDSIKDYGRETVRKEIIRLLKNFFHNDENKNS